MKGSLPLLTLLLLTANLLAAFAVLVQPELVESLGFRPEMPTIQGAATSLFLHANVAHLLGNLLFLAAVGAAVEMATGWTRFAGVYGLSGLAGVALYWVTTRRLLEPAPLVGASGAVAGCAAYYSLRYFNLRVLVAPNRAVSTAWVTAVWFGLQLLGAVLALGSPVAGVAFFAHLGGFLMGLVLGVLFRAPDPGKLELGHQALARMNDRGPDALAAMARRHLKEHPDDPEALRRLGDALADLGEPDEEAEIRARQLRSATGDDRRRALARLLEIDPGRVTGRRRLQMADAVATEDPALARRLLGGLLDDASQTSNHPDALLALAKLSSPPDPSLLERLTRDYPMSAAADLARGRGLV